MTLACLCCLFDVAKIVILFCSDKINYRKNILINIENVPYIKYIEYKVIMKIGSKSNLMQLSSKFAPNSYDKKNLLLH